MYISLLSTNIQFPHRLAGTRPHIRRRRPRDIHILPFLGLLLDRRFARVLAAFVLLGLGFLLLGLVGRVRFLFDLLPFGRVVKFILDSVQDSAEGCVDRGFELVLSVRSVCLSVYFFFFFVGISL